MRLALSCLAGAASLAVTLLFWWPLYPQPAATAPGAAAEARLASAQSLSATPPPDAADELPETQRPVAPQSPDTVLEQYAALNARLAAQTRQIERLRGQLGEAFAEVDALRGRVDRLAAASRGAAANAGARTIDGTTFIEAGFDATDADYLAQRWNDRHMELLYLRNQAIREGWRDSQRYRDERRELVAGYAFDQELEAGDYERFLYATGQPNRVAVTGVIGGSPGSVSGIEAGDIILSYDGAPIYNGADLRRATTSGEPDQPVDVLIERGGRIVTMELPRGAIGVRTENRSVALEP